MPAWIAEQTQGYVLATDIDTSWLQGDDRPFDVGRHDVGADPAPDDRFDLVHARLVLVHVPDRTEALTTMVRALKPADGSWWKKPIPDSNRWPARTSTEHHRSWPIG